MSDREVGVLGRFHSLVVESIVDEARGCRSFVLGATDDARAAFKASPGQFVTIRVSVAGQWHQRCYSVSSLGERNEPLRITVKSVSDGTVSRWLNEAVGVGDQLAVAGPSGRFLLRASGSKAVFFAAGSGITPILPMIRRTVEIDNRSAALFYWNRCDADLIFGAELRDLAARFPLHFELIARSGARTDENQKRELKSFIESHRGADAYLCGPQGFMELVRSSLLADGLSDDSIFEEHFSSRISAAEVVAKSADASPVSLSIVRDGASTELEARSDQILLDAMLSSGLVVPHSCKEGHCGACIVRLVSGTVDMLPNSALSRRDRQKGLILACRSKPTSPKLELSYDF